MSKEKTKWIICIKILPYLYECLFSFSSLWIDLIFLLCWKKHWQFHQSQYQSVKCSIILCCSFHFGKEKEKMKFVLKYHLNCFQRKQISHSFWSWQWHTLLGMGSVDPICWSFDPFCVHLEEQSKGKQRRKFKIFGQSILDLTIPFFSSVALSVFLQLKSCFPHALLLCNFIWFPVVLGLLWVRKHGHSHMQL